MWDLVGEEGRVNGLLTNFDRLTLVLVKGNGPRWAFGWTGQWDGLDKGFGFGLLLTKRGPDG